MHGLAFECVDNILSFLPIADVIVCRSVCEKWKEAADCVIRRQKALTFFVVQTHRRTGKRDWIVLRQNVFLGPPDAQSDLTPLGCWQSQPNRRNAGIWIKRLQGFVRLEKLAVVTDWIPSGCQTPGLADPLKSLINAVIVRNASTLIAIDMKYNSLLFDHKPEQVLVYGKLQDLDCEYLTSAAAAACPRLVHLNVRHPVSAEVMQNLSHETMQYLHVKCHTQTAQDVETVVAAVSRMTQLKDLKLDCQTFDNRNLNSDHLLTQLFSNMKQLETIDIDLPLGRGGTVDVAIDRLVDNNPRLTHIDLHDANFSGASVISLSRLTALQRLSLRNFCTNIPTTDGILRLLRGGSRDVLQFLELYMRSRPDKERIEAELAIMEQEVGCKSSVVVTGNSMDFSVVIKRGSGGKEVT